MRPTDGDGLVFLYIAQVSAVHCLRRFHPACLRTTYPGGTPIAFGDRHVPVRPAFDRSKKITARATVMEKVMFQVLLESVKVMAKILSDGRFLGIVLVLTVVLGLACGGIAQAQEDSVATTATETPVGETAAEPAAAPAPA
ncbi:MAG: hypothetical protein ACREHD_21130, partial [Pirellulales bacterium]